MRYRIEDAFSATENSVGSMVDAFAGIKRAEYQVVKSDGKCAYRIETEELLLELVYSVKRKMIDITVQAESLDDEIKITRHFVTRVGANSDNVSSPPCVKVACGEEISRIASVMRGKTPLDRPLIFLSRLRGRFESYGFDINADRLAENLHGFCDCVTCELEDEPILRRKSNNLNPENGYIGIYYPDGSFNVLQEFRVSSNDCGVEHRILIDVFSWIERSQRSDFMTYDKVLLCDMISKAKIAIKTEKINTGVPKANTTELSKLKNELLNLKRECARLKNMLSNGTTDILSHPTVPERRSGEYRDCVVAALEYRLKQCAPDNDRLRQVLSILLSVNEKSDYEERMARDLSAKLKNGRISPNSFCEWGISFQRQNKHMMFAWENISFSVAVTPSDVCSAENQKSHIMRRLCVCN